MGAKSFHRVMAFQTKVVFIGLPDYKVFDILYRVPPVKISCSLKNWCRSSVNQKDEKGPFSFLDSTFCHESEKSFGTITVF